MKREVLYLIASVKRLLNSILGIKEGTDVENTIVGIKRDIVFRGHAAWILIFSILIASIGLNANSPAVIIGAMLISPLMGPILGVGLSMGTNDMETLIRSLKNLLIAVVISLVTSTAYFMITPLNVEQSELLARTSPTILDVLIAMFGGFAGIIAGSRKEKSNVIPGVAIATALMPPLCTAGFGLANMNMKYFLGAFYLFFINSVFISLSTFLVVKYLKFPMKSYMDPAKVRKYRIYFSFILLIVIFPSAVIFWRVIQETRYKLAAEQFITENATFENSELINQKITHNDTLSVIDLYYLGQRIEAWQLNTLYAVMPHYKLSGEGRFPLTQRTVLNIHQSENDLVDIEKKFNDFNSQLRVKILEDIYAKNESVIRDKEERIRMLEEEIFKLKKQDTIPFSQIRKEIKVGFDKVEGFAWANTLETYYQPHDSLPEPRNQIPTLLVHYQKPLKLKQKKQDKEKLENWIKVRLNLDTVRVIEY